jgi:hypothetical protein
VREYAGREIFDCVGERDELFVDVGARSLKSSRMAEMSISSSSLEGVPEADE